MFVLKEKNFQWFFFFFCQFSFLVRKYSKSHWTSSSLLILFIKENAVFFALFQEDREFSHMHSNLPFQSITVKE